MVEFSQKTFVILGSLQQLNRAEAWNRIRALGGYTSKTPRPSSDYIVIGQRPSAKKLALIEKHDKPTLTEDAFIKALLAAEGVRGEDAEDLAFNDVVGQLRALGLETPSAEVWAEAQKLLDACDPNLLGVAVDYIEQHVAAWPDPSRQRNAPMPRGDRAAPYRELRLTSAPWRTMALAGERSPKLHLARGLDLNRIQLTDAQAKPALTHPDLTRVHYVDLGSESTHSPEVFDALRTSPHLPALHTLVFHHMDEAIAEALGGPHAMTSLRCLALDGAARWWGYGQTHVASFDRLFQAEWCAQLESLTSCNSGGFYPGRSCYRALARRLGNMPRLKHVEFGDPGDTDALMRTPLLRQLEQLSFQACGLDTCLSVLTALAKTPKHSVRVIDLSRGALVMSKKDFGTYHKGAVDHLLSRPRWGELRELVVLEGVLGKRRHAKLKAWADDAGVTLSQPPYA